MRLRKALALERMERMGFEDGLTDSETEPLQLTAEEKVTYARARARARSIDARCRLARRPKVNLLH